jgi:pimeloyl-ACP methyl ester carboxylesterase
MELTEISVPMLVMHGADDGCMDRRLFEHAVLEDDFPSGVEVREIEGAGHFLHLEAPEIINKALLAHLDAHPI